MTDLGIRLLLDHEGWQGELGSGAVAEADRGMNVSLDDVGLFSGFPLFGKMIDVAVLKKSGPRPVEGNQRKLLPDRAPIVISLNENDVFAKICHGGEPFGRLLRGSGTVDDIPRKNERFRLIGPDQRFEAS